MTFLRQLGYGPTAYIDDIWLVRKTKRKVEQKIINTRAVPKNVDFVVNKKSLFWIPLKNLNILVLLMTLCP